MADLQDIINQILLGESFEDNEEDGSRRLGEIGWNLRSL